MNTLMILAGLTGPAPESGWFASDGQDPRTPSYDWGTGAPQPYEAAGETRAVLTGMGATR